ncbi:hypothetical protein [Burkholderia pseudomallei]|uniref:hypothetical protein n=1 Tax=Burkholderia pseudomallei TaxID=28450 RepID=UPI00100BA4B1|nr:hypothetical protein [Burkholderia pseudomallei]MCL4671252.1 hypothetical protein [Burkholderia pseudomallei]
MPDLERQIREFLYQFAVRRESLRPSNVVDRISHELIDEFLRDELLGRINKHNVQRRDGFTSLLSGLYCWDVVQRYRQEGKKSAVDEAIVSTLEIYPKNAREVGEDAIRKNYNTARVAIDKVSFGTTATS